MNKNFNYILRAVMTLALTLLTTATAWAEKVYIVSYIDADGKAQTASQADVIDTSMGGTETNFNSDNTWFFARGNVTLNGALNNSGGTLNIILGDNATLTINGRFSFQYCSVNIYCQSGGTGKLVVSHDYNGNLFEMNRYQTLTINGGTVEVTNTTQIGFCSAFSGNLVMNGGTARFICDNNGSNCAINGNVTLNGGTFTASSGNNNGVCSGEMTIADGMYFKDDSGNAYTGTLTDQQKMDICGKTLTTLTYTEYLHACLGADNDGSADHPYTISNAEGWNAFCLALEDNTTWKGFSGKTVYLGTDIGTAEKPITRKAGDTNHEFLGNFDGGGNTLTFTLDNASDNYTAPFGYVKGGNTAAGAISISNLNVVTTITAADYRHAAGLIALQSGHVNVTDCNATVSISSTKGSSNPLHLYPAGLVSHASNADNGTLSIERCTATGTIATDGKYAGGLVGIAQGTTTVTNCRSSVAIESSTSGDGTHGGLVGVLDQTSGSKLTIEGCVFDGKLLTKGTTPTNNCGGFVGWNAGTISISNSLYAPATILEGETEVLTANVDGHPSATFARDAVNTLSNCYYTRTLGTAQGKKALSITAGQYVTVAHAGTATPYATAGITIYPIGIGLTPQPPLQGEEEEVLYACQGDRVSLTLGNTLPATYGFFGYTASDGTIDANGNNYTLTMPDGNVIISAEFCASADNLHIVGETGPHSVTVGWDNPSGDGFQYALLQGHNIDLATVNYEGTTTASEMTWDDLTIDSDYSFVLRRQCSADHHSQAVAYEFRTEVACPAPKPALVEHSETSHSATVSWTGFSDNYRLEYCKASVKSEDFEGEESPADWNVEHFSYVDWSVGIGNNGSINEAHSGSHNVKMNEGFFYLVMPDLDLSQAASATISLWYSNEAQDGNADVFGIYYRVDGGEWKELFYTNEAHDTWTEIRELPLEGLDDSYQIGFYFGGNDGYGVTIDDVEIIVQEDWNVVAPATSPYTIDGLAPATTYRVRVTGDCGSDGLSLPSNVVSFNTLETCPVPAHLDISKNTLSAHEASLAWTADNGSYNIKLNKAFFKADFETGDFSQAGFTTSEGDLAWTVTANSHSGDYCAKSASGQDDTTSALELTVTLENAGTLSFSAKVSSEEGYDLAYFIIDGVAEDNINGISGNGDWIDYEYPLSAGTHTLRWEYTKDHGSYENDDCFYVDDITIVDGNEVGTYASSTNSYTLTGLDGETTYAVKVQGVCDSEPTNWSETCIFTTLPILSVTLADDADNTSAISSAISVIGNYGGKADVTLAGRKLYRDGAWNTLCLPFAINDINARDEGGNFICPLHGATLKTLVSSSYEDGTLTMDFTEDGDNAEGDLPSTAIAAGVPYIVKWTPVEGYENNDAHNIVSPKFNSVAISSAPAATETNGSEWVDFIGSYSSVHLTPGDKSVLFLGHANTLYWPNAANCDNGTTDDTTDDYYRLNANRAYFQLKNGLEASSTPSKGEENSIRAFKLNFGDGYENTGIMDAEANSTRFTLHSSLSQWYDLSGRKLDGKPTAKGIYIYRGKKLVIK